MHATRLLVLPLACAALLASAPLRAEPAYALRASGPRLLAFGVEAPQVFTADRAITGVAAGEVLVGIDMRPQNGLLYALGVNAVSNTATLYALSKRTGVAGVVGTPGAIAFVDGGGFAVDLPDPASVPYGFDVNPAVDRVRVVAGGLNFRVDPNTGLPVDGNFGGAAFAGVNPDGSINGGTTIVSASAYTNNQPNNAGITTLYTLDDSTNALFLQAPPNAGSQTMPLTLLEGGSTVDFSAINGFDIGPGVNAPANNAPVASGNAYAALRVGGVSAFYRIALASGQTTFLGPLGTGSVPIDGLALQPAQYGIPVVALSADGGSLVRFNLFTPGTSTTVAISGVAAGDALAGLDLRPQTGQLYALGVNDAADAATLYRLDPQTGVASAVGAVGQVALVDTSAVPVNLPAPGSVDYGIDFNPAVDRLRVTTASGLNFRINPGSGAVVDADPLAPGPNPDLPIQGSGSTGVGAAAYTNNFGQDPLGAITTLYTLDAAQDRLFVQNPANAGTQTLGLPVTVNGVALDFSGASGFDIPGSVSVAVNGAPAQGIGYAVLTVGGVSRLYAISLADGRATALGNAPTALRGLALGDPELELLRNGFE